MRIIASNVNDSVNSETRGGGGFKTDSEIGSVNSGLDGRALKSTDNSWLEAPAKSAALMGGIGGEFVFVCFLAPRVATIFVLAVAVFFVFF